MDIREIAELVGGVVHGEGHVVIESVADISDAGPGQLAFFAKAGPLPENRASCVIVCNQTPTISSPQALIAVSDPKLAFAIAAEKLIKLTVRLGRHVSASISATANVRAHFIGAGVSIGDECDIGNDVEIGDGTRIGNHVQIGDGTVIFPNCVIYDDVRIGKDCVLHAGSVIGADGFGFVRDTTTNRFVKFPQIGAVVIGDEVEIGAGTCVDRGALGDTVIGDGTKIDNLVQIAHNVQIGKRVVIAAQTGISGSTIIEDDCVIGGQVGMGDHARVQSGAVIGSQAGVLPGKIVRPGVWWGTPIQPLEDIKRQHVHLKRIGDLKEKLKALEARLAELESPGGT